MTRQANSRASALDPETAIDTWRDWGLELNGRPQVIEQIQAGKTNRNYRLSAPGLSGDLVLRVNHPDSSRLGIDRKREHEALLLTAKAGIARPFLYWDPEHRFTIFPYLPGRAWTATDLEDPEHVTRLRALLDQLHQIVPPWPRRQYHAYVCRYWEQLEQTGQIDAELAAAWRAFEPRLKAFDRGDWTARLVHHDLIPANILESEGRLYLIDWEYVAAGHPEIDLWTISPDAVTEPFIGELMRWINDLWERLVPL